MNSQFRWQGGGRRGGALLGGALLGGALLAAPGCGDAFNADCASSRSCAPPLQPEGEGGEPGVSTGAPGSGAGGLAAGGDSADVEAGAGGQGARACKKSEDCSNGDAADGDEQCVAGVCKAGNAPPSVVSITPGSGVDDAEPDVIIEVEFSEPLDPATVTPETFKVFARDVEISGALELSTARDQVRFAPEQPLDLFGTYRIEVSKRVSDSVGLSMLGDVSASFQVRDGAWSVTTLAAAEVLQLPADIPVASNGALLTSWLAGPQSECKASTAWVLRGEAKPSGAFTSEPGTACELLSASIAADGGAVVGWHSGLTLWSQSFAAGKWAPVEDQGPDYDSAYMLYAGGHIANVQVFAHPSGRSTILVDKAVNGAGDLERTLLDTTAASTTSYQYRSSEFGSRVAAAFGADGFGIAAWTDAKGVHALIYDADIGRWSADATTVTTSATTTDRSVPSIALSPDGDAVVLWFEGPTNGRVLKSSRLVPGVGWDTAPVTVGTGLGDAALFDAPALVFDGETFVAGWTAATGGILTTYTARYDMSSKKWDSREPHLAERGESAALMPRLGADSQHNLMLLWAVGGDPFTLVYRRYRAEVDEWGDVREIEGATFSDASLTSDGKLPFGFAPNGLAGVMFRGDRAGGHVLELAQFY